ncbi:DUF6216 family protein [Dryocola clanedunensis]|uniref:DUF6216 family protein n=1 Tax=Cedecea sulfonylureivorans TaxID=3051154 RepID=UPI00192670DF|nr:DUF6216 family protein [Cedecea sulfonylureivorans]
MESVAAIIVKYDTIINSAFWLILLLSILFYISLRAGSAYSIVNRLWQFFLGPPEFFDKKLNKLWNERNDIEHFNMLFNVKAKNKQEINKFISWVKNNKIDIIKISRAKGWFNFSTLEAVRPKTIITILILVGALLCIYGFFVTMTVAAKPAALVKIEKDEPWIWVGLKQTSNYIPNLDTSNFKFNNWSLSLEQCVNKNFDRDKFSLKTNLKRTTIDMLCKSFTDEIDQKSISAIIKKQNAFFILSIIPVVFCFYLFIAFIRRVYAVELANELKIKIN